MKLKIADFSLDACANRYDLSTSLRLPALPAGLKLAPSRAAAVIDSMPQAKTIDQVAISPDGTRSLTSSRTNSDHSHDWRNGSHDRGGRQLALRDVSWSPDSKQIAFIADLPGDVPAAQVWTARSTAAHP